MSLNCDLFVFTVRCFQLIIMSDILVTPPTPTAIPKAEAPTSPVAQASFDSAEARSAALRQNIGILQKKIEQLADICGVPKISSGTNEVEAVAQMAKVVDVMIKMHLDQRLPSLPKEGDYFVSTLIALFL